jgi:gamma-D-glutamyl-L-lysine dipeptidyl-peptidase
MTGIITLSLVPLRVSDSETSEMTSQLLFGEEVKIIEVKDKWYKIQNLMDNYYGWVDRKMIHIISTEDNAKISTFRKYYVSVPLLECTKAISKEKFFLPGGSILYNLLDGKFVNSDEEFFVNIPSAETCKENSGQLIVELTKQYLNSPYLWGGKSAMGIDCSGLVQVVYSMIGKILPRDASQQVDDGIVVDSLAEAQAGDLAFFENPEGKIIHVGILINQHQIIHASGWVKIENVDSQGIISSQTGEYTHKLRMIKRLI